MPSLGVLTTYLDLNADGLNRNADAAKDKIKGVAAEGRKLANDIGQLTVKLGAVGAGLAVALVNRSADAAREMKVLAGVANTTTTEFQRLAFGAKTVQVENDKLADILKDVNDRVGDFLNTGGGPMADFFDRIAPKVGVTADQFRNLSGPQALQLYVDSLEKANLSQAEMTFFMEAMASDSSQLIPLLRNQGAAMEELGDRAERVGLVLSEIEIEQLEQAGQAMSEAARQTEILTQKIVAQLAPVVTALSNYFLDAGTDAMAFGDDAESALQTVTNATGFVLDAVEGIKRTFQVAGRFAAVFALSASDAMLTLARDIVNFPTAATNQLIDLLNIIPGVDIDKFGMSDLAKDINEQIITVRDAINIGWEDINSILLEPLPSSQFKVLVDEAVKEADRAVEQAQRVREVMGMPAANDPSFREEEAQTEAAEAQRKLEEAVERIRQRSLAERDQLAMEHEAELAMIDQAEAAKAEVIGGYEQLRLDTKARHEEELTDIERRAAQERNKIVQQELQARQATIGQILGNISTLMNTESRKMFEIGKVAGIANATVSTLTGAAKALELGWPLGPIAAGAIALNGFAKVQAIQSQSFGGSGGASAAASNTAAVNAAGAQVTGGVAQGTGGGGQSITLNPINPTDLFTGEQVIRLANEAMRNGSRLELAS